MKIHKWFGRHSFYMTTKIAYCWNCYVQDSYKELHNSHLAYDRTLRDICFLAIFYSKKHDWDPPNRLNGEGLQKQLFLRQLICVV